MTATEWIFLLIILLASLDCLSVCFRIIYWFDILYFCIETHRNFLKWESIVSTGRTQGAFWSLQDPVSVSSGTQGCWKRFFELSYLKITRDDSSPGLINIQNTRYPSGLGNCSSINIRTWCRCSYIWSMYGAPVHGWGIWRYVQPYLVHIDNSEALCILLSLRPGGIQAQTNFVTWVISDEECSWARLEACDCVRMPNCFFLNPNQQLIV